MLADLKAVEVPIRIDQDLLLPTNGTSVTLTKPPKNNVDEFAPGDNKYIPIEFRDEEQGEV